jgi:hypothetical protein
MQDADFSDEFCSFIQKTVPTVEAVDLLLILSANADMWWSVAELAARLRPGVMLTDPEVARYVEIFQKNGLLATRADKCFQYRPETRQLDADVQTLAQAYRERPVTLIRMIYALRDAKIRSFADAFKLRGN